MKATSPAGRRRPGAGNTATQTDVTEPHPRSPGWGRGRLQNAETVLPAQVCAKPHTPDGHRSGEGTLHFNISKRHCLFLESLCHVHTTLASFAILLCTYNTFQCKSKWTAKHSIYISVRILQRIKA